MKVTAIQTAGAYGATAAVGRGREGPVTASRRPIGPDPDPILHEVAGRVAGRAGQAGEVQDADVERLVEAANEAISHTRNRLQIERHQPSKRFVMKLIDRESGELVRQYPAEELLRVSERLAELRGMLFASEG